MKPTKRNMQKLLDKRAKLVAEMDALKHQIAGLDMAIAVLGEEAPHQEESSAGKPRRTPTKAHLLRLLEEVGATGLNAQTAVELADRKGVKLSRDSVSSILSRLKADEVVLYDGEYYRLKEFVRPAWTPSMAAE